MTGAVLRLAVVLLVTGAGPAHAAEPDVTFAQIGVGGRAICTGAVVQFGLERQFVTAAHCLKNLDLDQALTISENAEVAGGQVVSRAGQLDLKVGEATVLLDFDVALWPLKIYELTGTRTLTPRLTELEPGETVVAHGYPGDDGAVTLACLAQTGTLTQVDGFAFRPAALMSCATPIKALGGMSGGPALDANGRYLGLIDYQSVSGERGRASVGFVPYRVFKPVTTPDGTRTFAGLRYGYTFRDYQADAGGATKVHVSYRNVTTARQTRSVVEVIEVRTPLVQAQFTPTDVNHTSPVSFNITGTRPAAGGRVVNVSSYPSLRSVITELSR